MSDSSELIPVEPDKEWERLAARAQSRAYEENNRAQFSEVTGLCRTCKNALIRRRQYSEMPSVICKEVWEQAHVVPLDITECSGYERTGAMSLNDMHQLGLIIDSRKKGGQYL